MFYRLLGMFVWKAGKFYVSAKVSRRQIAGLGGLLLLGVAAALLSARRGETE